MQTMPGLDDLFERRHTYPDFDPQERLARLVGLDDQQTRLAKRGQGRVGEMTQLLSAAFEHTVEAGTRLKRSGKAKGGIILLVDEADALAQSREAAQMHHEDRAGVNAFIRGIDRLANLRLPA